MVGLPEPTPVTVAPLMVAIDVLLLLQAPPAVPSVSVIDVGTEPPQIAPEPEGLAGLGLTV